MITKTTTTLGPQNFQSPILQSNPSDEKRFQGLTVWFQIKYHVLCTCSWCPRKLLFNNVFGSCILNSTSFFETSFILQEGGGYLVGQVDQFGSFTGENIAFVYPDFQTAILGRWTIFTENVGWIHEVNIQE